MSIAPISSATSGTRERRRPDKPPPQRRPFGVARFRLGLLRLLHRRARVHLGHGVARLPHRRHECRPRRLGRRLHARVLGGEVDGGRLHARHVRERPLHAAHARGARHPEDGQVEGGASGRRWYRGGVGAVGHAGGMRRRRVRSSSQTHEARTVTAPDSPHPASAPRSPRRIPRPVPQPDSPPTRRGKARAVRPLRPAVPLPAATASSVAARRASPPQNGRFASASP